MEYPALKGVFKIKKGGSPVVIWAITISFINASAFDAEIEYGGCF